MAVRSNRPSSARRGLGPASRVALLCGFGAVIALAAPAACIYPDYTFDELEPTGAGGTGSVASASSTTTTSGGAAENCLNGADDDGDTKIDCADEDCGSYTCIASAPVGWTGHFALYVGEFEGAPECPKEFPSTIPYQGTAGLMAGAATCAACACGASSGEGCNLPDAITVIEKSCVNQALAVSPKDLAVPAAWDGSCYATGSAPGGLVNCGANANEKCNTAVKSTAPGTVGGSCPATGGEPTLPAVTWQTLGKACGDAPPGGGCAAGQVCQPNPSSGYRSGVCIYKEGENACPGTPFTEQFIFYKGVTDQRGCTDCACDPPEDGSCTATITVYSDAGCTNMVGSFTPGQSCGNLPGANSAVVGRKASNITVMPGTCAPKGGEPTGTAIPSSASTFCCVP